MEVHYRAFSPEREVLAKEWAGMAMTVEKWETKDAFGATESKPFKVERDDGFLGLAKPGEPKGPDDAHAGHEKIASDLAFHLGLPIAPAILWDRGTAFPTQFVCISAWAFPSCDIWARFKMGLNATQIESTSPVFSAMAVFETWISADDRNKEDAVLIDGDSSEQQVGLSFFDYAFSLSRYWKDENAANGKANSFHPAGTKWDLGAGKETAEAIASFDQELLKTIIHRIPDDYLTGLKKSIICANLTHRAERIHALMGL